MTLQYSATNESVCRRAKTILFCPSCDHESSVDGDWIEDDSTARHRLLCPRCGDIVIDQPQF